MTLQSDCEAELAGDFSDNTTLLLIRFFYAHLISHSFHISGVMLGEYHESLSKSIFQSTVVMPQCGHVLVSGSTVIYF